MGADVDGLDRVVTVTVNSPFVAGDFGADTIRAAAAKIYDGAGNTAPITAVPITISDTIPPTILTLETVDLNGNGYIDAIRITFSKPISDATVNAANFTVAGASGLTFSPTTNGDTPNNAVIYITFTDGVLKTDATPTVTYTAGTLTDLNGNALASTGAVASLDKAGPAVATVDDAGHQRQRLASTTIHGDLSFSENWMRPKSWRAATASPRGASAGWRTTGCQGRADLGESGGRGAAHGCGAGPEHRGRGDPGPGGKR